MVRASGDSSKKASRAEGMSVIPPALRTSVSFAAPCAPSPGRRTARTVAEEFRGPEWFGKVVIRSGVEAGDAVVLRGVRSA